MTSKLYWREEGSGSPLVLLHGWACHGGFFEEQVRAHRGRAHVLVPDLPGHGQNLNAAELTIEAAADAVFAELERRNLRDVTLCGWSMGAHVAFALAQRHGTNRIRQFVAVDMAPKVLNDPEWPFGSLGGLDEARNHHLLATLVPSWAGLVPKIAQRMFATGAPCDPGKLMHAEEEIRRANPELLKPMWASLTTQDFRSLVTALGKPLHLVFGGQSALYGAGTRNWYLDHVPGVELNLFEAAGHSPHLEDPERFSQVLGALLAS
ncbi:alpha/beta hydrolase [Pseudovibrio exalbescens]|uniref:alpha/beta fold hydrolase n=1 Tax=Pseudovibrio exalbescens TaxID=197461 RepID=UPI002366D9DF|nr:alpha/beta hydrolase [Pseudovibrio exalbescens]MDD7909640.1 alpha/beta hydrolase [Pseudovibrio exalbescens]